MPRLSLPPRDEIKPDTPLRLSIAAAVAFPDGSMTASGLRRERDRGRLVVERIASKEYTTLANIERMRQLCRVGHDLPGSTFEKDEDGLRNGSSSTAAVKSAQERAKEISKRLKRR
jgi:hypothetical protein